MLPENGLRRLNPFSCAVWREYPYVIAGVAKRIRRDAGIMLRDTIICVRYSGREGRTDRMLCHRNGRQFYHRLDVGFCGTDTKAVVLKRLEAGNA